MGSISKTAQRAGTIFLLIATILLTVVSVSPPVTWSAPLLNVRASAVGLQASEIAFGSFGYCQRGNGIEDWCSSVAVGYDPAAAIAKLDSSFSSNAAESTAKGLTGVMVLHPVAAGLCFVAFLFSLSGGGLGTLLGTAAALGGFIVTSFATICDLIMFGIVKHDVNQAGRGAADWGTGIWLLPIAIVLALLAAFILLVSCLAARGDYFSRSSLSSLCPCESRCRGRSWPSCKARQ